MKEITGILQQMIDAVKGVAPSVWGIYVRQVMFEAYTTLAWSAVSVCFCVILWVVGKRLKKYAKEEDPSLTLVEYIPWMMGVILIIVICCRLNDAFLRINNPEYYAIQKLLPGGGCR